MTIKNKIQPDRKKPIDSYTIERESYDYIREVAKAARERSAFGHISKSDIVSMLIKTMKENSRLRARVFKRIEANEMKSDIKLIKKHGLNYLGKLRRSQTYKNTLENKMG